MPRSILITQCLQNDFVQPLGELDPLPNELHIGAAESRRLLGDDPNQGPLSEFLRACYRAEDLAIVHLRDWHRKGDPAQKEHLQFFGDHCLAETVGAQFVPPLQELETGRHSIVDCRILNDCEETPLPQVLAQVLDGQPRDQVRVGVIGVWTDVKVKYLLYDLKTRLGLTTLGVCSALVASRHRRAHFDALEHIRQVLGVHVVDSVGEFLEWLGGTQASAPLAVEQPFPQIEFEGHVDPEVSASQNPYRRLVKRLFRNCRSVSLQALGGGFSGSKVFHAKGEDSHGYIEAPVVLKMDRRAQMAQERVNYERVENILGSNAPHVKEYVEMGDVAGIKYLYASMGMRPVRTLKEAYQDPAVDVTAVLEDLWQILGRMYRHAHLECIRPLDYYEFKASSAPRRLQRLRDLLGDFASDTTSIRLGSTEVPNPTPFYSSLGGERPLHYVYHSYSHGDLNTANVLLDDARNMWMIDFFHAGYHHVLRDLAKLENDMKFILTPLEDEADLDLALLFEKATPTGDLAMPELPTALAGRPQFVRLHQALSSLRRFATEVTLEHADVYPYRVALLRYAAHSLTFEECDLRQKRWAAGSVCILADALTRCS